MYDRVLNTPLLSHCKKACRELQSKCFLRVQRRTQNHVKCNRVCWKNYFNYFCKKIHFVDDWLNADNCFLLKVHWLAGSRTCPCLRLVRTLYEIITALSNLWRHHAGLYNIYGGTTKKCIYADIDVEDKAIK